MDLNTLIIVPARLGSTRVPHKNLRNINEKPLIYYSINAALNVTGARVIVSTDSTEIANYSQSLGAEVPFLRPVNLSGATSSSISVIIHTLSKLIETNDIIPDLIIFKPPTNPFLKSSSIQAMLDLKLKNRDVDSVMSIFVPKVSALSYLSHSLEDKKIQTQIYDINGVRLYDNERSQDRPLSYASSPACKITETKYFLQNYIDKGLLPEKSTGPTFNYRNACGYVIDNLEAIDIDTMDDILLAEIIMKYGAELIDRNSYLHL